MPRALKPVLDMALGLLARREHATTELSRKLRQKGYPPAEVSQTLQFLASKNYLDDARYAAARARYRALQSKWGPAKIKQELAATGISKDLIATAMGDFDAEPEADWLATATRLLTRKFKSNPVDNKDRARRLAFLQRRGFTMDQALKALASAGGMADVQP